MTDPVPTSNLAFTDSILPPNSSANEIATAHDQAGAGIALFDPELESALIIALGAAAAIANPTTLTNGIETHPAPHGVEASPDPGPPAVPAVDSDADDWRGALQSLRDFQDSGRSTRIIGFVHDLDWAHP